MKYRRTYEIVDLISLKEVVKNTSTTHTRYYCPFCTEKRGKKYYSAGKLYFDKNSNIGLCHQCNTVVFPENKEEIDEDKRELELSINSIIINRKKDYNISKISYNFENVDSIILNYLKNRNELLIPLYKYLNIKKWIGNRVGVVIPFYFKEDIVKIQVRFIDNNLPKYWTSPGIKPLYSPFTRFKSNEKSITICEGVFDAIALAIMGYSCPLACLGSTLTNFQIYQIRSILPENCLILMDEPKLGYNVKNQLRKEVGSLSMCFVDSFNGKDPEEYLRDKFNKDIKFKERCINNVKNIVKEGNV